MDPWQLNDVSDWFVVLQKMWCEDFDDSRYLIKWHNAYRDTRPKKHKLKKTQCLLLGTHWCVPSDEKQGTEKLWV